MDSEVSDDAVQYYINNKEKLMSEMPRNILDQFYLKRLVSSCVRMFEVIEKLQLLIEPKLPTPFEGIDISDLTPRNQNV